MKNLTKKTAVMLVVAMLLAMLPVSAFAAYTPDWTQASVVLTDNVDLTDLLTIDHDLALDLAGKTITAAADKNGIEVVNGATLTITDSVGGGKIVANGSGNSAVRAGRNTYNTGNPESPGYIVFNSGSIEAPNGFGITVWTNSSLTMNGGSVSGVTGISGNGQNHGATITVNGGSVNGTGLGIYAPGNGVLNIAGGEIVGGNTGVEVRGGELNVTGGSVTGKGPDGGATPNISGHTVSGAAIAVSPYADRQIIANISAGVISAPNGVALAEKDTVNGSETVQLSVTGGTLSGVTATETDTAAGFITGGTLSGDVQQGDLAANKTVDANGAVACDHEGDGWFNSDAAAHWEKCAHCGKVMEYLEHVDANGDGYCDTCGWIMNTPTGRQNPSTGVGFFAWLMDILF